jgi:hypothetical protein
MGSDSFYVDLGQGRFRSTEHSVGPWKDAQQHLGPPSALLGRAIERCAPRDDLTVGRVTVEILGPVPVAELTVTARVERTGRSIELIAAELTAGGRAVAQARAWRFARTATAGVAALPPPLPAGPDAGVPKERPDGWLPGYLDAMEWSSLHGGFDEPGPATMWARQRVPLVLGEQPSGLQRLLTVADSGNGVSGLLDPRRWFFINAELTVHVLRPPEGDWIALDASTDIGPAGVGVATSTLHDHLGPVARGAQALLVRPR